MTQLHVLQSVYEDIKSRIQQRGHDVQVTFPIEEYQYPFVVLDKQEDHNFLAENRSAYIVFTCYDYAEKREDILALIRDIFREFFDNGRDRLPWPLLQAKLQIETNWHHGKSVTGAEVTLHLDLSK